MEILNETSKKKKNMIIIGRENQYHNGINFLQIDLKINVIPIKIPPELVTRTWQADSKIRNGTAKIEKYHDTLEG